MTNDEKPHENLENDKNRLEREGKGQPDETGYSDAPH